MRENNINKSFIQAIKKLDNSYEFLTSVKTAVASSNAKYIDKPIPFLYHPIFWSRQDMEELADAHRLMSTILQKVVSAYLHNKNFREHFGFDHLTEKLILVDPGYKNPFPMARFDVLYHSGQNFKFCEFNTDGSSGMNEDNVLAQLFLATKPLQRLGQEYNLGYFELLESWVDECLINYWEFSNSKDLPNVAIVDWEGVSTIREFEAFKRVFQAKGCQTIITDPRNLEYKCGKLYKGDFPIDLVYRRLVNHEVVQGRAEITDFIKAYTEQAVCVVGPLRSQIIHNKVIFKILHDEEVQCLFKPAEVAFIKSHIPYTAVFKEDKTLLELAKTKKDHFILKPSDLYGSQGVFVGKDLPYHQWKGVLQECWDKDFLLQEFVEPPESLMFNPDLQLELMKQVLGVYLYNGKISGLYSRVGRNNVISTSTRGFVVPNLSYE